MYKISHEKCVCFVFLLILAILSCTAFRIDSLAMADLTKRNFHPSTGLERLFHEPHRIRHQRPLRSRQHAKPHVEALVFPPTTHPSEQLAQLPSTDLQNTAIPTKPLRSRPQRSSRHKGKRRSWSRRQEVHVSLRARNARFVILAKADSCSMNTTVCFFKIKGSYTSSSLNGSSIRLDAHMKVGSQIRLDAHMKVEVGKKYLLFLNGPRSSNYTCDGPPVLYAREKKKMLDNIIRNAMIRTNETTLPKIVLKNRTKNETRRMLICLAKGFPVPKIVWRRNGVVLQQNDGISIQFQSFRNMRNNTRSRLVFKGSRIPDPDLNGTYECVADNGKNATKSIELNFPKPAGTACTMTGYCDNGGTCRMEDFMEIAYCICPPGYSGEKCNVKVPSDSSLLKYS